MKKKAPAWPASSARLMVPWPLMTMTSGDGIERLHLLKQVDAVGVGQQQVEEHDAGTPGLVQLQRAGAVAGDADFVARLAGRLLDDHLQPVGDHRLVVDDEHSFALTTSSLLGIHAASKHPGHAPHAGGGC